MIILTKDFYQSSKKIKYHRKILLLINYSLHFRVSFPSVDNKFDCRIIRIGRHDIVLFQFIFVFIVNSLSPCFATSRRSFLCSRLNYFFVAIARARTRKARHKCIVKSGNENSFDTSLTVDWARTRRVKAPSLRIPTYKKRPGRSPGPFADGCR